MLFKWNKAQITQPSPNEQAGSCICPEQDSYLTQEAWRFWASFSPTWSFSWFRSSRASSLRGHLTDTFPQATDGETAWLLSANRQRIDGFYLPLEIKGRTAL